MVRGRQTQVTGAVAVSFVYTSDASGTSLTTCIYSLLSVLTELIKYFSPNLHLPPFNLQS